MTAINYYSKNKKCSAVSFNADYINWFRLDKKYTNLIRIKEFDAENKEIKETSPYFKKSFVAGSITNTYAREYGTIIFVFEKAKIDINQRIKKEIAEEKQY